MKKAISPLISWVLIVAFVIFIGAFVSNWAINYVKNINLEKGNRESIYCDNAQLKILNSCRINDPNDNNLVNLSLYNAGSFNISILTMTRATENRTIGSCLVLNTDIAPNSNFYYEFDIDTDLNISILDECYKSDTSPVPSSQLVTEFSIIPWIIISNNKIACNDKKVNLNVNDLNEYCT